MNPLLLLLSLLGTAGIAMAGRDEDTSDDHAVLKKAPPARGEGATPPGRGEETAPPSGGETTTTPPPPIVGDGSGGPVQDDGTDPGHDGSVTAPAEGALEVYAGRVTTISAAGDDVASVRILSATENGTVTVNPDNSMALVLTLSTATGGDGFSYEVTHGDGTVTTHHVDLNMVPGPQQAGWATGEAIYMLETDENDRIVVEHGDNHVTVYASGAPDALSLADIAELEGIPVSAIDRNWMKAQTDYGFSEDTALDPEAAGLLWDSISSFARTSNWLMMERGYEYDFVKPLLTHGSWGESELHPLYIGSWGEGDKPVILSAIRYGGAPENVVIQDVEIAARFLASTMQNLMIDDAIFAGGSLGIPGGSSGVSVRGTAFFSPDEYAKIDLNGDGIWDPVGATGGYVNKIDGFLMEDIVFDHIGWEDDALPDSSIEGGRPTMWFSHNFYIDYLAHDVTLRDIISMRAAHDALNVRSSGYVENVVLLDNNYGMAASGGDYAGSGPLGHYLYLADSVISGGAARHGLLNGAMTTGINDKGHMSTYLDNVIAHLADPNDPDDMLGKRTEPAMNQAHDDHYYDDTIVWNWDGQIEPWMGVEKNYEGLDPDILNQTTYQNFVENILGEGATLEDFGNYLRAEAEGRATDKITADMLIDYFQKGFGIDIPDVRTEAETLRFVPNDLADGVRWDNRINWSTEDLPGAVAGDSVDLGGNHVIFNGNADIAHLDMDTGAVLEVHGGRLDASAGISGDSAATLEISGAGQVWTEGAGGGLDISVDGGRIANTGLMHHADLDVLRGQAILGVDDAVWELDEGHHLSIFGAAVRVGFDGETGGTAILEAEAGATFHFEAGAGGLGTIEEFRSGALGDAPDVLSGIDLGGATIEIDIAGLDAAAGQSFLLMDADEIVGLLDEATATVGGLGTTLDATIVIDYAADAVRLELTAGTGAVSVRTSGEESQFEAGEDALWTALTEGHGMVDDLPDEEQEFYLEVA